MMFVQNLPHLRNKPISSPIKILSLQTGTIIGGTELMVFSLLSELDKNDFEVTVCFYWDEGPISQMYQQSGIEVIHLNRVKPYMAAYLLWQLLSGRKFDIIEIYGLRLNLIGRLIAYLTGHKIVFAAQRSVDEWRRFYHTWLDRITSCLVTLYITNTHIAAQKLQEREKIPLEKILVLQNAINVTPFNTAEEGCFRNSMNIDLDEILITCIANFKPVKNHILLIDALKKLRNNGSNFRVCLVGDGPTRLSVENHVKDLNLDGLIFFTGQRRDIPSILKDTDIFVLSSNWEGMPNVILEAMAARVPVIATKVGGISEVVVHGETGILVIPNKAEELAEAILQLMNNPELRRNMGELAYQRVCNAFDVKDRVAELSTLYQTVYELTFF